MKLSNTDLRTFIAIADWGSLSAAARHLGVQKSTVSRDLGLLEAQLGHRLAERTTRRLRLTEAGAMLLGYARRVMEEVEAAEAAMAALSAEPSGILKVTATHGVMERLILRMLPEFLRRYPKIRVSLDASSALLDLVAAGIDVAIRGGELASSTLIARKLGDFPRIVVAAPRYLALAGTPRMPRDIETHQTIGIGELTETSWTFEAGGAINKVALTHRVSAPDLGLAYSLALSGIGMALLHHALVSDDLMAGRLIQLFPEASAGVDPLYAVYPSRRTLAPKVKVFVDAIAEFLRNLETENTVSLDSFGDSSANIPRLEQSSPKSARQI